MPWTRWNAPSDYDYYDQDRTRGIERTCSDCGDPVMVDRGEIYQVHVYCHSCIERAVRRRAIKAELAREKREGAA